MVSVEELGVGEVRERVSRRVGVGVVWCVGCRCTTEGSE